MCNFTEKLAGMKTILVEKYQKKIKLISKSIDIISIPLEN